jgi:hypothetical protein
MLWLSLLVVIQKCIFFCDDAVMKKVLLYVPIVLSLAVLGAHFMRYGNSLGVSVATLLIALLFVQRAWVARLVQAALILGAAEWLHTIFDLVEVRIAMGEPYVRMTVILGVVAAVTACSALLFQTRTLRAIYCLDRDD